MPTDPSLRLGVANDSPLVVAGVTAMLAPFRQRVTVRPFVKDLPMMGEVDVMLLDTFASPQPLQRLHEAIEATAAPVLVYSWVEDQTQVEEALQHGAAGFCSKGCTAEDLLNAVENVGAGRSQLDGLSRGEFAQPPWPGQEHGLAPREAEIVALITQGLSNQQIAERLYLSVNSVKTYVRTGYRKMGVRSRPQAVIWAVEHGFLEFRATVASAP